MDRISRLRRVILLCCHFSRNLAYYRVFYDKNYKFVKNEFWLTVNGNFLDVCVLEWCKLFGNRNDDHHWFEIVENPDLFKQSMFDSLSIDQIKLDHCWKEIKAYRDEFVAHLESKKIAQVPVLDLAWNTVEFYFNHINEESLNVKGKKSLPRSLKFYYDSCYQNASKEYAVQT